MVVRYILGIFSKYLLKSSSIQMGLLEVSGKSVQKQSIKMLMFEG